MTTPRNKLQARDKIITALLILLLLNVFQTYRLSNSISELPKKITVDTPPDISIGITRALGERDPYQIAGFALTTHQLLNTWDEEDKEYKYSVSRGDKSQQEQLINDYRCLLTPEFREELLVRNKNYLREGDYFGQERVTRLISGKGFSDESVYKLGNSWVVDLPIETKEYWRGEQLFERHTSYQYRVVEMGSQANCPGGNRWGFRLAGFYSEPQVIRINEDIES